jgi:hypothetical protein
MNTNSRFAVAMTLALTTALISTVAQAQSFQTSENTVGVKQFSGKVNSNLIKKIQILQPGGALGNAEPGGFADFKEKPGFADFTRPGDFQNRINPAVLNVRPSAVDTFKNVGH